MTEKWTSFIWLMIITFKLIVMAASHAARYPSQSGYSVLLAFSVFSSPSALDVLYWLPMTIMVTPR
jgi:hypothetical protein